MSGRFEALCSFARLADFFQSFGIGEGADVAGRFPFIDHANQVSRDFRRQVERNLIHHMNLVRLGQRIVFLLDVSFELRNKTLPVGRHLPTEAQQNKPFAAL